MKEKLLSIIVPVFNESGIINEFYRRVKNVVDKLGDDYDYELLYINDGSTDDSLKLLIDLSNQDERVRIINFSRNFGHQIALSAGIDHCKGDIVVLIDADLQDPPEIIPKMIQKWKEGFEVVYGQRTKRAGESKFKLISAKLFYRLINFLSDVKLPLDTGDFRLIDKKVIEYLRETREENSYLRGLVTWVGFNQCPELYERDVRYAGTTHYPIGKMLKFAINGLTSFSEKPLILSSYFGSLITFISFIWLTFYTIRKILNPEIYISGWTSLIVLILFLGGIQLICMGIIGIYIGRIFRSIKNRPKYVVKNFWGNF